jgi:ABC-type nitrate/sulfonate/bicarbonate transport system substrate-binding protein
MNFRPALCARLSALVVGLLLAFASVQRVAAADDKLTVVSSFPGGIEVLEEVAQNGGLYKAEHLDVEKVYSGNASACAQMVATGKGDVCGMSIESIIFGYPKGLRLQTFFARTRSYDYVLAVPSDSPIRTLADFKGQPIGEPGVASPVEIPADDMLMGAGLRRSDIVFVPVGVEGQALAALASKKIVGLADSDVALATKSAVGHITFRIFRDPILDSLPNVAFAARPDVIESKAGVLERYARAIVKAALLIRENPRLAARYALQSEGGGSTITPAAIETEVRQLGALRGEIIGADPASSRIGSMPLNGVALYCKFFYDTGLTSSLVPADAIVTNRFVAYANDFDKKAWIAEVKGMR